MSGLRHHLLSLTAAGLGVALGLGLGAGPVTDETVASHEATTQRLTDRGDGLQERVDGLTAARAADGELLSALSGALRTGRLKGRSVLVVASPGARNSDVRRVRTALDAAGGRVTNVLFLTGNYVDPTQAQAPLEDLALRLVPPGVEFTSGSSAIERVGVVLARATVRGPAEAAAEVAGEIDRKGVDRDAAEVIAGLEELDAVRLEGRPGRLADLAVLVTGPGRADGRASGAALAGLLAALDAGSQGAVLAGPGDARTGPLRWARDAGRLESGVSTVDSLDDRAGGALLVLALAEQVEDGSGDYGLGRGARAVLPAVPSVPALASEG